MVFLVAGVYAVALSVMIFSSIVTPVLIDLFVRQPYTLGTHGADWEYWHGMSCAFVGIVALFARSAPPTQQRHTAIALTAVYVVWGLQNLRLVLMTDRYGPLMWGHVIGCLGVGIWAGVEAARLRTSK